MKPSVNTLFTLGFPRGQPAYFQGSRSTSACKQHVLFSALKFHFVVTARGLVLWWAVVSTGFIGYESVWSSVMKVCLSVHQCQGRFNKGEKNMKKQQKQHRLIMHCCGTFSPRILRVYHWRVSEVYCMLGDNSCFKQYLREYNNYPFFL